jgi:3,4-dihydroxy 2-butanone 4-phosphate synthase/GTP cyclohydrolase II
MGMGEEIARALGGQDVQPSGDAAHPLREYGVGAQILKDLGVRRMILMSNTRPNVLPGLDGYGLTVEGWRRIDGD